MANRKRIPKQLPYKMKTSIIIMLRKWKQLTGNRMDVLIEKGALTELEKMPQDIQDKIGYTAFKKTDEYKYMLADNS